MLEERVGVQQPPDLSLDLFHGLALLRLHPLVVLAAVPRHIELLVAARRVADRA
jgi:hypothetical protein